MNFTNKLLLTTCILQFADSFSKKYNEDKSSLSEEQLDYVTNCLINSIVYKELIKVGKTPKEISKILQINKMTKQRFFDITGKVWPK